ncbi:MAG: SdrD B-like domain-containing protein [Mycobacteriales bacterium]
MRMPAGFKRRPGWRVVGGTFVVVATLGVSIPLGLANLPNSTFDAGDGNLVLNDEAKDWVNAPNFGKRIDLLKGQGDDAMGNGTSEDTEVPSLVTDGIPPNKSDITRFYVGSETISTPTVKNFLYLAWERISDPSGTTNFDFELNQSTTLSSNLKTPVRTPGDVLIKYDLANGGTTPVLGFHRWIDPSSGSASSLCEANSKFPCWDKAHTIAGVNFEAAINLVEVDDPIDPSGGPNAATGAVRKLSPRTFGEAAIDLVGAGILPQGTCAGFASAYLKSRSSDSFNAAIKDFAAPTGVNVNNCGALAVNKYIDIDESGTQSQTGNETTLTPLGGVISPDLAGWNITITGPSSFSCTGSTNAAGSLASCLKADTTEANLAALAPGTYTITENANAAKTLGSNASAFFNTDPGTSQPWSEQATVGLGGTVNVNLGNTCQNTATFQVTDVPASQTGLFVRYWTTDAASFTDVNLVKQGATTTWQATAGGFHKATVVHWQFGLNSDKSVRVNGPDQTMPGYPSCAQTKSAPFGSATISGVKYKDLDVDGVRDAVDSGTAGFTIQLKQGSTVVASTKSSGTGAFSFTNVDPGTYTLHELSTTGWIQTEPASNGDITVNVPLGATSVSTYNGSTPIRFGNSPLSRIGVTFESLGQLRDSTGANTGPATRATSIDCTHGGTSVGSSTNSNTNTTNNLDLTKSQVTCVITYEDP